MAWIELFRSSFLDLTQHKLRTFLTMLGIIFGVGAVMGMLAIGEGAKKEVLEAISELGTRNIFVKNVPIAEEDMTDLSVEPGLHLQDLLILKNQLKYVNSVCPLLKREIMIWQTEEAETVIGTTPDLQNVFDYRTDKGRFLNNIDLENANRVAVLGPGVARKHFPLGDYVGKRIKLEDDWYTVIGVMTSRSSINMPELSDISFDFNQAIYVPLRTLLFRTNTDYVDPIIDLAVINVISEDLNQSIARVVNAIMEKKHTLTTDYQVVVPELLLKQRQKMQNIFNIVMGAIAGISLLVGGIGIMNIMLASVLERTREIGIRRSIGATRRNILLQFVVESSAISLIGGIIGLLVGFLIAFTISHYAGWKTSITIYSVVISFGISTLVGMVFGIYPARQASRLNVIDALRYE